MASWGRVKWWGGESRKIPSKQSHCFPARGSGGRARGSAAGGEGNGTGRGPRTQCRMVARRGCGAPLPRDRAAQPVFTACWLQALGRDEDRRSQASTAQQEAMTYLGVWAGTLPEPHRHSPHRQHPQPHFPPTCQTHSPGPAAHTTEGFTQWFIWNRTRSLLTSTCSRHSRVHWQLPAAHTPLPCPVTPAPISQGPNRSSVGREHRRAERAPHREDGGAAPPWLRHSHISALRNLKQSQPQLRPPTPGRSHELR